MSIEESRDEIPTRPTGERLVGGASPVWLAALAAVFAVLAATLWGVPWWAGAVGTAALSLLAWGTRRRIAGSPVPRISAARRARPVWPETGMKALIDALDDPCILVDAGGTVRYVNAAATGRWGEIRRGDPLSFRLRVIAVLDALDRVVALAAAETVDWQEKVPTERWLRAHLSPIRHPGAPRAEDGLPAFVLIRIEDLTEYRRVERMRADFVANASHELRTPLAAVIGFLETLQGPARNDDKVRDRFLAVMAEQAGRMKRLIDDLLSLSRVEMRVHLRPETIVDLGDVLHHVVDLVTPAATAAGVELRLAAARRDARVRGDRDELVQVFTNLVENAVKYGGSGGRVEIALDTDPGDDRHLSTAVRDFGPGIDPVHLPRLTERFYRAHTETSGEKRGTGLGLAIVKHIVARHGGRLSIDSALGRGSTFTVRLDRPEGPRGGSKDS